MNKQERESLSVTENFRKPLPTAKDLGLDGKPCDFCGGGFKTVGFWGATSVLVCAHPECQEKMAERWDEAMAETRTRQHSGYWEDED